MASVQPSSNMGNPTFDVLIVGGGHAGLSAALTLYRQLHSVAILDGGRPRNQWAIPTHIVSGWEGRPAEELRAASRAELLGTQLVTFAKREAASVERTADGGFEVRDASGGVWRSRKLLIAAGKHNVLPAIPGFADNYPDRIFHCMFTFGYEHRGAKRAGLLAEGALSSPMHAIMVISDTLKFAERVTIFTNADAELRKTLAGQADYERVDFDDGAIAAIAKAETGLCLEMGGGCREHVDFLVHQPATAVDSPLVKQLDLQLDERGDIVNKPPFFQTNVPGVFAAGDCASPFRIIPMAMFMGANAAAGIARELGMAMLKPKTQPGAAREEF